MFDIYPAAMHSTPNFAVLEGESRLYKSSAKQQQAGMFMSKDILEKLAIDLVQRIRLYINHQIFTYFVQRRSFLSSCYHLNLKQAFKVKNLVPMTMHHAHCHWSRALYQVASALAPAKRPLFPKLR